MSNMDNPEYLMKLYPDISKDTAIRLIETAKKIDMALIKHTDLIDENVIKRLREMELAAKKASKAMDDLSESIKNVKTDYPDFFDQI